jgi:hypothetical protein
MSFSNADQYLARSMTLFTISEDSKGFNPSIGMLPSRNSLSRTSNQTNLASLAGPPTSLSQNSAANVQGSLPQRIDDDGSSDDWGFFDDGMSF